MPLHSLCPTRHSTPLKRLCTAWHVGAQRLEQPVWHNWTQAERRQQAAVVLPMTPAASFFRSKCSNQLSTPVSGLLPFRAAAVPSCPLLCCACCHIEGGWCCVCLQCTPRGTPCFAPLLLLFLALVAPDLRGGRRGAVYAAVICVGRVCRCMCHVCSETSLADALCMFGSACHLPPQKGQSSSKYLMIPEVHASRERGCAPMCNTSFLKWALLGAKVSRVNRLTAVCSRRALGWRYDKQRS